jgi:lipopolysaccharide transport system ATP-binding protein
VGLAAVSPDGYDNRERLTPGELHAQLTMLCLVPQAGQLTITLRSHGLPVQLLHHGVANLPGSCEVTAVPPDAAPPPQVVPRR